MKKSERHLDIYKERERQINKERSVYKKSIKIAASIL